MTEKERDNLLLELKADVKRHDAKFEEMNETLINLQANVGTLNSEVADIKKEIRELSGSVARMEKVFGERIQAVLDVVMDPINKVYSIRDEVDAHEDRLFEHDIRIRALESKVSNS